MPPTIAPIGAGEDSAGAAVGVSGTVDEDVVEGTVVEGMIDVVELWVDDLRLGVV